MYEIVRELESKISAASDAKDELENAQSEIEDFINAAQELIDSLNDLPTVNIDVSFDSDSV